MATAGSPTGGEKKEDDRKKLTKVLSTKVSVGDYDRFEIYKLCVPSRNNKRTRDLKTSTIYCSLSI
jgi:hypothetical protein